LAAASAVAVAAFVWLAGRHDPGGALRFRSQGFEARTAGGFDVVSFSPAEVELRLYWSDPGGKPLRTYAALEQAVEADGRTLLAATNAGIFEPGLVPTGLYVQRGSTQRALERGRGRGNFYMRPNGVFFMEGGRARVLETGEYAKASPHPGEATQSGPLLVRAGQLHPQLTPASGSLAIRSAIGVRADGAVVLAVSREEVNLYAAAAFMRDQERCPDALYLDGYISTLHVPAAKRPARQRYDYAGMIALLGR
jgi:uncharacterized protein YigE (DUF2233 family)